MVSQALLALDTDHIKSYVFGTSKLKEIRGASSILDYLNRTQTVEIAKASGAQCIYANGGSALFLIDAQQAEPLGKEIQKLYTEATGGGASITYAVQPIPENTVPDIMTADQLTKEVTMAQVLKMLRTRLRLAKETLLSDSQQKETLLRGLQQAEEEYIVLPSHILFEACNSCGTLYAEDTWLDLDPADPDDPEGRYCRSCINKREENKKIKKMLRDRRIKAHPGESLWGHILHVLENPKNSDPVGSYTLPPTLRPPKDFHAFRDLATGKGYLGLIYADANGMGKAIEKLKTLQEVQNFANKVDNAVFAAMGDAIRAYLPVQGNALPFDILLIGGDDIVLVTPAEKALHVAHALAERFHFHTNQQYTLSVSVVLAPISYPFPLQHELVDEAIKAAKKAGATTRSNAGNQPEPSQVNFVVVTGNTSLSYAKIYEGMYQGKQIKDKGEFYATLRPYTLNQFRWLLQQLKAGNEKRLGRTKLHQLREAILKLNRTTTILEALALLRNWQKPEREFIKDMVKTFDTRSVEQQQQETLFPWYPASHRGSVESTIYCTPLLDFIELYDFVSIDLVSFSEEEK